MLFFSGSGSQRTGRHNLPWWLMHVKVVAQVILVCVYSNFLSIQFLITVKDMSPGLFQKFASLDVGVLEITWGLDSS